MNNSICPLCLKNKNFHERVSLCSKCFKREEYRVEKQNKRAYKKNIKDRLTINDWIHSLDVHGFSCARCKSKGILLTLDHIVSMCNGGTNEGPQNIQPLCSSCHEIKSIMENKQKGNKKKRQEITLWKQIWENTLENNELTFKNFMENNS